MRRHSFLRSISPAAAPPQLREAAQTTSRNNQIQPLVISNENKGQGLRPSNQIQPLFISDENKEQKPGPPALKRNPTLANRYFLCMLFESCNFGGSLQIPKSGSQFHRWWHFNVSTMVPIGVHRSLAERVQGVLVAGPLGDS